LVKSVWKNFIILIAAIAVSDGALEMRQKEKIGFVHGVEKDKKLKMLKHKFAFVVLNLFQNLSTQVCLGAMGC